MTQADDAFIKALDLYTVGTARPGLTAYTIFRAAAKTWRATHVLPVPVLTPNDFTLAAGYGSDAFVGEVDVDATNAPTSFEIVSGNDDGYFAIYNATGNLRTSETVAVPPGTYSIGIRGINANGPGPAATFGVTAQGVVDQPPPPPPPPTGSWPDASNTGVPAGTVLTNSGGMTISTAGAVVEDRNISGTVNINAKDVTLRNCKVRSGGYYVVRIAGGVTGARVEDCEIDGVGSGNDGSHGIMGQGTFLRNNIYNVENGITLQGNNSLIQDNYIHGLKASGAPHYDGIQIDGGISNVVIEHNTVECAHSQTAAVMIDNWFGPILNIKVNNNYLSGGGYTIYVDGQFSGGSISLVSVTNNRMVRGYWGYTAYTQTNPISTGNVNAVTGAPI